MLFYLCMPEKSDLCYRPVYYISYITNGYFSILQLATFRVLYKVLNILCWILPHCFPCLRLTARSGVTNWVAMKKCHSCGIGLTLLRNISRSMLRSPLPWKTTGGRSMPSCITFDRYVQCSNLTYFFLFSAPHKGVNFYFVKAVFFKLSAAADRYMGGRRTRGPFNYYNILLGCNEHAFALFFLGIWVKL
jgi:hypothetical protein